MVSCHNESCHTWAAVKRLRWEKFFFPKPTAHNVQMWMISNPPWWMRVMLVDIARDWWKRVPVAFGSSRATAHHNHLEKKPACTTRCCMQAVKIPDDTRKNETCYYELWYVIVVYQSMMNHLGRGSIYLQTSWLSSRIIWALYRQEIQQMADINLSRAPGFASRTCHRLSVSCKMAGIQSFLR